MTVPSSNYNRRAKKDAKDYGGGRRNRRRTEANNEYKVEPEAAMTDFAAEVAAAGPHVRRENPMLEIAPETKRDEKGALCVSGGRDAA